MLDALAERGVTDAYIDDDDGRAPEHITVNGPEGVIYISTEEENVSLLPSSTPGLLVEYSQVEDFTLLHDSTHAPVTPALIADVADLVTEFVHDARTR